MTILGTVFESIEKNGFTVENIPYKKHDYPCEEGCCENMLSIGIGTASKVSWLLRYHMPSKDIKTFDFNNWSDELNQLWKEQRKIN